MDPFQAFGWGNRQIAPVEYSLQWLGVTHTILLRFLDPVEEGDVRAACNPNRSDYVLDLRTRLIAAYVVAVDDKPLDLPPNDRHIWSYLLPEPVAVWIAVCWELMHMRRLEAITRMRDTPEFRDKTVWEWRRMRDTHAFSGRLLSIEETAFVEFHMQHDESDRMLYDMGQQRIAANSVLIATRGTESGIQALQRFIRGNQEKPDDVRRQLFETNDRYFGRKPDAPPEIRESWRKRWYPDPPQRR